MTKKGTSRQFLNDGSVIKSVLTDQQLGIYYAFNDVEPGDYVVKKETNSLNYWENVWDGDILDNGYAYDLIKTPGNLTLLTATTDPSICRVVTDDQGNPLSVLKIQLQKPDGTVGATVTTGSNGMHCIFPEVEPATDVLDAANPPGYPGDQAMWATTGRALQMATKGRWNQILITGFRVCWSLRKMMMETILWMSTMV
jgi:hypothetical protein